VALVRAGIEHTLLPYDHAPGAPSYGEEAADALGLDPDTVFKTLVARVDGTLTLAVVPVSGTLVACCARGSCGIGPVTASRGFIGSSPAGSGSTSATW
jgi:hypothetical protein